MIDSEAIFKNKVFNREKLSAYGFALSENGYTKNFSIMQGEFSARVAINRSGIVDFRVYEAESGEEYVPARVRSAEGAFIGAVHEACEAVLKDICRNCCYTEVFRNAQSKRILEHIRGTYGAEPEFLWPEQFPECAALRVPGKKSWFAVVGSISKDKIGIAGDGKIEVINLKDTPEAVQRRIDGKRFFKAYHMNKQHWYTTCMDDRIPDEQFAELIAVSFRLVGKSFYSRKPV